MEHKRKEISPDMLQQLLRLLEETEPVPLVISGSSMVPFLVHGRDTVFLSRIRENPRRGDMILYRRDNGMYVLHRVFRAEKDGYTMVGDAQTMLEPGIRRDQMLARVTALRRKGKLLKSGSFWWEFFEKIWIRMVPLRPALLAIYSHLK